MSQQADPETLDRRQAWRPEPRPEWAAMANSLGEKLDIEAIVPLDEQSLIDSARRSTGLDDFDEDGWREHFAVLVGSIRDEARLNLLGRILTRSDLIRALEARLRVTEAYRRNPEIEDEVVSEPVFILGMGRSGTTILHETMAQDPQFGTVIRRDAVFPAGNGGEGEADLQECAALAQGHLDVLHAIAPELGAIHAMGAGLPVEDIEFSPLCFLSEMWLNMLQLPTYERYVADQPTEYTFHWHKRVLKLLQWRDRRPHWLLKNPTFMKCLPDLLDAYPDAKIILPHRDPVVTTDSVVNILGAVYHARTDHPYCYRDTAGSWADAASRAAMWDGIIDLIESGRLREGYFANSMYAGFMSDPAATLTGIYDDLRLSLKPDILGKMTGFLELRHLSGHGNRASYAKSSAQDQRTREERSIYARYQEFFQVPPEI